LKNNFIIFTLTHSIPQFEQDDKDLKMNIKMLKAALAVLALTLGGFANSNNYRPDLFSPGW